MARPLTKDPIPKRVEIREVLRILYGEGKIDRRHLVRSLMDGQLSRDEYFKITGDMETLRQ